MNKSFAFKGILIIFVVIVIDQALGCFFKYCASHAKGGEMKWEHYEMYESTPDVAIFGSSRAIHHYDTRIMADSLGEQCINYGKGGFGIIYGYALYKNVIVRKFPKVVILDVFHVYDLEENDNIKYVAPLKRFTDLPEIAKVVYDIDPMERFKQTCQTYKWNSDWYYYLRDAVKNRPFDYMINGFFPLNEKKELSNNLVNLESKRIDETKLSYLKKFIQEASHDCHLYVFVSPYYKAGSCDIYNVVEEICKEENVTFINFWRDNVFNDCQHMFSDHCHLNEQGAVEYTKYISHIIKTQEIQQSIICGKHPI